MPTGRVLVVEDESSARSALASLLREEGYETRSAADGFKALGIIDEWAPDVILTDLKMPGLDGVELMDKVRTSLPGTPVILMTAHGSVDSAVNAMMRGADDYLPKPVDFSALLARLDVVLRRNEQRLDAQRVREQLEVELAAGKSALIGRSRAFRDLMARVDDTAALRVPALVVGEPGCGLQLVAKALHERGAAPDRPYVEVSCGTASADALMVELLGDADHTGALARAGNGTVVLEEVAATPRPVQERVAHALRDESVEARVVATSTRELEDELEAGKLERTLYDRLNVVRIRVPSLAERSGDIPLLASYFLDLHGRRLEKRVRGISTRAMGVIEQYSWPGNLTQLEACMQRAVALANGVDIEPRDLPPEIMSRPERGPRIPGSTLDEIERYAILRTLEEVGGSTSKAAKMLGISPRKIQYRMQEYKEK